MSTHKPWRLALAGDARALGDGKVLLPLRVVGGEVATSLPLVLTPSEAEQLGLRLVEQARSARQAQDLDAKIERLDKQLAAHWAELGRPASE